MTTSTRRVYVPSGKPRLYWGGPNWTDGYGHWLSQFRRGGTCPAINVALYSAAGVPLGSLRTCAAARLTAAIDAGLAAIPARYLRHTGAGAGASFDEAYEPIDIGTSEIVLANFELWRGETPEHVPLARPLGLSGGPCHCAVCKEST
jgi:hypothetical protein